MKNKTAAFLLVLAGVSLGGVIYNSIGNENIESVPLRDKILPVYYTDNIENLENKKTLKDNYITDRVTVRNSYCMVSEQI